MPQCEKCEGETDQFGARSQSTPGARVASVKVKEPVLTLPPLSSAERYLTLNEFQHVKLEHWVLDFEYSFQDRLFL